MQISVNMFLFWEITSIFEHNLLLFFLVNWTCITRVPIDKIWLLLQLGDRNYQSKLFSFSVGWDFRKLTIDLSWSSFSSLFIWGWNHIDLIGFWLKFLADDRNRNQTLSLIDNFSPSAPFFQGHCVIYSCLMCATCHNHTTCHNYVSIYRPESLSNRMDERIKYWLYWTYHLLRNDKNKSISR